MNWVEALLVGAVVASTDAAAVFFLINAGGLRLRTRVGATLEAESGSNDPFAVLLTVLLVEYLIARPRIVVARVRASWPEQAVLGTVLGILGGRAMVYVLNRLNLAQGLHAPFVAAAVIVIFGLGLGGARLGLSRRLSRRAWWSETGRRARTTPSWCFSTP